MKVVVRTPSQWCFADGMWHFLEHDDGYYLYVNCEHSAVCFPIMVKLSEDECVECHALGWTFLEYFAEKINYWQSKYSARRVGSALLAEAQAEIKRAGQHS